MTAYKIQQLLRCLHTFYTSYEEKICQGGYYHLPHQPVGDAALTAVFKNYLITIDSALPNSGDKKGVSIFFSNQYHNGCWGHPDMNGHQQIAAALAGYICKLESW